MAKLANKVHLSDLVLRWNTADGSPNLMPENHSSDPQEDILEALHPPFLITSLKIFNYSGSAYPSWFSREQGAPKNLQHLELSGCCAAPEIGQVFVYLRTLVISNCRCSSVPDNMGCLTCLEELSINNCKNILSLPRLPESLKKLTLTQWEGSSLSENMESPNVP